VFLVIGCVLIGIIVPLCIGGVGIMLLGKRPVRVPGAILFHSVSPERAPNASQVSARTFAGFLDLLRKNNVEALSVREAARREVRPCDRPACVITFDDGFDTFYNHALPELESRSLTATIFPVVDYIGKRSTWDIYSYHHHMSIEQLRTIGSLGHEIGSHTLTHPNLTFLSMKEVRRELRESKHRLEDILGTPVCSLSFPFGSWNRKIWDTAREIGYTAATIYRGHHRRQMGLIPVRGSFSFNTEEELFSLVLGSSAFSVALAQARIMPHFAKGTPIWKFREGYSLFAGRFPDRTSNM
jgi:peptidoglycan/xylan/chitin deacetylase (PgdA/CDA1 family)